MHCCGNPAALQLLAMAASTDDALKVPVNDGMQEGLANVCLVGSSCTLQRARVETNMPRKRGAAAAGYDKSLESFFRKVGNHPLLRPPHCAQAHCILPAENATVVMSPM